jgi:hypothetical protein
MKNAACRGNALIAALLMVVVISGFVGVAYNTTDRAARFADRSRDYAASQSAAEGAIEYAFGVWKTQIASQNAPLATSDFASLGSSAPSFPGFSYATPLQIVGVDAYGAPGTSASNIPPVIVKDVVGYKGWRGRSYNYAAQTRVKSSYEYPAGVKRNFEYAEVPLFQAMYFFEHNIEFYRPAEMIVSGLVHTNSYGYISGSDAGDLTFTGNLSYVTGYSETIDPPYSNMWSGYVPNAHDPPIYPSGKVNQVSQVGRMEPLGEDPISVLNTTDTNPNNDSIREIIEPPNTSFSDDPKIATRRLYNKAGLRVNINGSTITVTGANGLTVNTTKQLEITAAISASTTLYDQREGKNVDVRSVDVGILRTALATGASGFNGVLYINDTTPITGANPEPKAVRLKNGGILPDAGLTVVSENPIYIQGDYNTGATSLTYSTVPANNNGNPNNTDSPTVAGYTRKPSAVIGDAVMFLSNAWADSNASDAISDRTATHTTYNTAIISGFMPSGYQPAVGAQYGYSGGANNFPRFLENWTDKSCTYYGSMVELFQSKTFTGKWDTGVIFRPPLRRWNFDTSFVDNPPPGSISGTTWSRGTWAKF